MVWYGVVCCVVWCGVVRDDRGAYDEEKPLVYGKATANVAAHYVISAACRGNGGIM